VIAATSHKSLSKDKKLDLEGYRYDVVGPESKENKKECENPRPI
jgi:hypothetical protein